MTPDSALEIVGAFLAVVLALALASVLLRPLWLPIWRLFHGTQQFLEDWNGEPPRPGFQARPGAMERLEQLEKNGGGTMRDKVDRLVAKVDGIGEAVEVVRLAAGKATDAADVAVEAARAGRDVTTEAAADSRAQVDDLRRGMEVMHEQITEEAAVRYADALELLADHGGPDLRAHVQPHVHTVDPSATSGPVETEEPT